MTYYILVAPKKIEIENVMVFGPSRARCNVLPII